MQPGAECGRIADSSKWVDPFRVDRRFGTSGAAQFLLRLYRVEPHDAYRDLATRIVDDILDRGVRDEEGLRWRLPRYGFQGDRGTDATFTGFFYGAAGLGLTLLEMHYTEAELTPLITFPDAGPLRTGLIRKGMVWSPTHGNTAFTVPIFVTKWVWRSRTSSMGAIALRVHYASRGCSLLKRRKPFFLWCWRGISVAVVGGKVNQGDALDPPLPGSGATHCAQAT